MRPAGQRDRLDAATRRPRPSDGSPKRGSSSSTATSHTGLALLDEAGVAAISGDLDALSTGVVYCELVCALQGLAQYDLAEEWTEAMERWSRTNAIGSLHGRCRVHRAEILRLRGQCHDAEHQALLAVRGAAAVPATRAGMAPDRARADPVAPGRRRRRGGGVDGRAPRRMGSATRPRARAPRPGRRRDRGRTRSAKRSTARRSSRRRSCRRAPICGGRRCSSPRSRSRSRPATSIGRASRRTSSSASPPASRARRSSPCAVATRPGCASPKVMPPRRSGLFAEAARGMGLRRCAVRGGAGPPGPRRCATRPPEGEHQAEMERQAARATLDRIAIEPSIVAATLRDAERGPDDRPTRNVFRLEGDYWSVVFEGRTVRIRDLKGMRYLARLLAEPERELHVLDLVAAEATRAGLTEPGPRGAQRRPRRCRRDARRAGQGGLPPTARGDRRGHRRRDARAATRCEKRRRTCERDFLVRELSRAVGLGGRDRRAGSASERARVAVTRAVRQAMARISEQHAELGEHLGRTIRTGTYCSYLPDPRVPADWDL